MRGSYFYGLLHTRTLIEKLEAESKMTDASLDIRCTTNYKAVTPFVWSAIPKLAIITGENGVGKTQFLDLIEKHIKDDNNTDLTINGESFNENNFIKLISPFGIGTAKSINYQSFKQPISEYFFGTMKGQRVDNFKKKNNIQDNFKNADEIIEKLPINTINSLNASMNAISKSANDIERLFFCYYYKTSKFEYEQLKKGEKIDREQIYEKFGKPPWDIVNEFLEIAQLTYRINNPENVPGIEFWNKNYVPQLIDIKRNISEINFCELSLGEKTIISLAFWLYNAEQENPFPKLILLDEPDAHLHPTYTRKFLDILKHITEKYNSRIIMTTHSPATIALAPENSVFEMTREEKTEIKKSNSVSKTIKLLSSGLLMVQENIKYVLVESIEDASFYDAIYKKLVDKELIEECPKLQFVAVSNDKNGGNGGCNVVKKEVITLNKYINNRYQGLIDKDTSNTETEKMKVIKRYSIENYLLDPIILRATILDKYPLKEHKMTAEGDEAKFKEKTDQQLQQIIDLTFSLITNDQFKSKFQDFDESDKQTEEVQFINSRTLKYPRWLLSRRGHDLLPLFQDNFTQSRKLICNKHLIKYLKRTEMIPIEFIEIFQKLQNS